MLRGSWGLEQLISIDTETWKVSHSIDNGWKLGLRCSDELQSAGSSGPGGGEEETAAYKTPAGPQPLACPGPRGLRLQRF